MGFDRLFGILDLNPLIIAGDLIFSLNAGECWGHRENSNPLAEYFTNMLSQKALHDVSPNPICPMWRNVKKGHEGINKIIDSFLVDYLLHLKMRQVKSYTFFQDISNHEAIMLKWKDDLEITNIAFKFN